MDRELDRYQNSRNSQNNNRGGRMQNRGRGGNIRDNRDNFNQRVENSELGVRSNIQRGGDQINSRGRGGMSRGVRGRGDRGRGDRRY